MCDKKAQCCKKHIMTNDHNVSNDEKHNMRKNAMLIPVGEVSIIVVVFKLHGASNWSPYLKCGRRHIQITNIIQIVQTYVLTISNRTVKPRVLTSSLHRVIMQDSSNKMGNHPTNKMYYLLNQFHNKSRQ